MTETLLNLEKTHVLHTYNRNMVVTRGEGPYIWDGEGNKYLDFTSGISVCNLGHCHPRLTKVIAEQAAKLVHCSNYYINEYTPVLAQKIAEHSFGGRCFFGNSGAEANEGMIKFARKWGWLNGGRNEIICMDNSFHGRTLGTLAATGRTKYREGFGPDMQGFSFANLNDLDSVKKLITDKTVAVMLEPVQGEGGVLPVTRDFICGVRKLCDENNLLLLLDEVQCGMARTGTYFAYERFGVKPDAMTIAKAIANGLPMGVFEVRQEYGDVLQPGNHGTTFGGNPLISAVACEVFNIMQEENIIDNVRNQSWRFFNELNGLQKKFDFVRDVRGYGLMIGVELDTKEHLSKVTAACKAKGLLVLTAGESVLRLMPPLNITADKIDAGLEIIAASLAEA
ncbi:MAG: aspartate aminotransferase family protein [Victivallales bacterium]|nr:aspartate aminotransferase family protein [Victivallales bacterium]MBR5839440.1 aspartate aminotransferase family protein [Victivallales bacterium]